VSFVDEPVFELLKLGRTVIQVSFPDARQAAANLALDISTPPALTQMAYPTNQAYRSISELGQMFVYLQ
jgi:hypothetical protein